MDFKPLGPRTDQEFAEDYSVRGVECQVAHTTLAKWEEEMASVRERLDVASPVQKALGGLLDGIPLHGDALIRQWQAQLRDYPDALARAMVEHYARFFPLWYIGDRLAVRDGIIWRYEMLVETAQHILGVLAGLNQIYYSPFQFRRMHRYIATMRHAPERLADRLDALFTADLATASAELERLVRETAGLVTQLMPDIDLSARVGLVGKRQQPWSLEPL
jgi:hypothetical protein